MTIRCNRCGMSRWCVSYNKEWVCKHCFTNQGSGTDEDWNRLNYEMKEKRRLKSLMGFDASYVDL